jgi:hypothetical protein
MFTLRPVAAVIGRASNNSMVYFQYTMELSRPPLELLHPPAAIASSNDEAALAGVCFSHRG